MNLFNHNKIQDLIINGYNFDIGAYFSEGIDIVKKEVGLFIGYTVVYFLIAFAANLIPFGIGSLLVGAPLIAGFYIGAHKVSGNEMLEFGDFFKGFDYFAQLLIQQLILLLMYLVLAIPFILIVGTSIFMIDVGSLPELTLGLGGVLAGILVFIGALFIGVCYMFAPFFVIFGDMQAWDAMEASRKITTRNFFPILGLILMILLINIIGMIPCFIGLLFTVPASYAIVYVAFKRTLDLDAPMAEGGDILDHLVD